MSGVPRMNYSSPHTKFLAVKAESISFYGSAVQPHVWTKARCSLSVRGTTSCVRPCVLNIDITKLTALMHFGIEMTTPDFKVKRSKLNTSCGAICESTANPVPVLRIAASHGFSELTKNVSWSSHGHSTPLKVSCKSVQPFSRNLANKETNKQRYKEIDRKQYPVPRCIGDGVITAKQCWKQHAL